MSLTILTEKIPLFSHNNIQITIRNTPWRKKLEWKLTKIKNFRITYDINFENFIDLYTSEHKNHVEIKTYE